MEGYSKTRKTPPEVRALWGVCHQAVVSMVASDYSDVREVVLALSYCLYGELVARGYAVQVGEKGEATVLVPVSSG